MKITAMEQNVGNPTPRAGAGPTRLTLLPDYRKGNKVSCEPEINMCFRDLVCQNLPAL